MKHKIDKTTLRYLEYIQSEMELILLQIFVVFTSD